jgi:hypothetical protein
MWAKELQKILSVVDERRLQVEPLAIAALTKYFRAFGTGRRPMKLRLQEASDLPPELRSLHDHLKAIRDRHVAHPVNRYEAHQVTIAVADLGSPHARVTAVSTSSVAIYGLSLNEVGGLIDLCDYWLGRLNQEKLAETARLLEMAQSLTASDLNALPTSYHDPLDPDPFVHR